METFQYPPERTRSPHEYNKRMSDLPQADLDSAVELEETSVEVELQRDRIVKVDRVGLVGVLDDQVEVVPHAITQLPELRLSLVLDTERKRWRRKTCQGI